MYALRRISGTRAWFWQAAGLSRRVQQAYRSTGFSQKRLIQTSQCHWAVKPYLLADIGEGITECQVISWEVKEGDEVDQFDPICEVQSDKASVEITSRFKGTIQKLYYDVGDVAKVGSALLDIDVEGDEDDQGETPDTAGQENPELAQAESVPKTAHHYGKQQKSSFTSVAGGARDSEAEPSSSDTSGLLSPAARRTLKERSSEKHLNTQASVAASASTVGLSTDSTNQQDRRVPLSHVKKKMFESMTRSLSVPHFLYTQTVDLTAVMDLRKKALSDDVLSSHLQNHAGAATKLSPLSFVVKALSQALLVHPMLNSVLDTDSDPGQPELIIKSAHNIGVAVDTSQGLLVPVIRNVQDHSVASLAKEISRLTTLASAGKLRPDDMKGATIVVSNIGSIGGQVVAPVILTPNTAIMAIGKAEQVPVFQTDENGNDVIVKRDRAILSWSADHRVLDGAMVAKCAEDVASWLGGVEEGSVIAK